MELDVEAELTLRRGADNNLIDINIGRLLDRERNSTGNRIAEGGASVVLGARRTDKLMSIASTRTHLSVFENADS